MALALMQRAFAVEQAETEQLLGDVPAAALHKGAVLPHEDLMDMLGMTEEHRAFRTEPEGDDIPVLLLEATHKAQHIAGERQQMGPGKAGPRAGWRRRSDHNQSFCRGAAPRAGGASPACGRLSKPPLRAPTLWTPRQHRRGVSSPERASTKRVLCPGVGV
jgi:hypothetical protein